VTDHHKGRPRRQSNAVSTIGRPEFKSSGGNDWLTDRERDLRQHLLLTIPRQFKRLGEKVGGEDTLVLWLTLWAWAPKTLSDRERKEVAPPKPDLDKCIRAARALRKKISDLETGPMRDHWYAAALDLLNDLELSGWLVRKAPTKGQLRTIALWDILRRVHQATGKYHFETLAAVLVSTASHFNKQNPPSTHIYPPSKPSLQALVRRQKRVTFRPTKSPSE